MEIKAVRHTSPPAVTALILTDLAKQVGAVLGVSTPRSLSQGEIDAASKLSGDRHWMHTDPERCAAESPFGRPVVAWYTLLSLIPACRGEAFSLPLRTEEVFLGVSSARFTAPICVEDLFVVRFTLQGVEQRKSCFYPEITAEFIRSGDTEPCATATLKYRFKPG